MTMPTTLKNYYILDEGLNAYTQAAHSARA